MVTRLRRRKLDGRAAFQRVRGLPLSRPSVSELPQSAGLGFLGAGSMGIQDEQDSGIRADYSLHTIF